MSKAITKQYRLLSMPHAQCRVYLRSFDYGVSVELISYDTSVCIINYSPDAGAALYCSGTYSLTTRRHINCFTREFCGYNKYFECKSAIGNLEKYVGGGWYRVSDVEIQRFLNMCERYESDARVYNGRY